MFTHIQIIKEEVEHAILFSNIILMAVSQRYVQRLVFLISSHYFGPRF